MKVADYVIEFLGRRGIDRIFVLYGAASGHLIDGFTRTDKTEYVAVLHEQGGGFAAECWGKVKNLPGAAIVTSGPGAHNMVTSVANCFYDSVPAIFISGQINANFMRTDPSIRQVGFQESDIVGIVEPITKYAKMVTKPEDIRYELEKAYFIANDRRGGPVWLDIPVNVQEAHVDPDTLMGFDTAMASEHYSLDAVDAQIDQFLGDLAKAERPVLLVGGGVHNAGAVEIVREVARTLRVPAFPTWNALDVITSDFEYYGGRVGTYGGPGRNFGIQNSDLMLSIGSRVSGRITGGNISTFARAARKYLVDIDKPMLQRKLQQVPFDVNILCDAKAFCERLLRRARQVRDSLPDTTRWVEQVTYWRDKYDPVLPEFLTERGYVHEGQAYTHPYAFMRRLSQKLDSDAIVTFDLGGMSAIVGHSLSTKYGQRCLTNNGNAPMGFAFAGALGAKIAAPDRQVVCLSGDGGWNMNIQELQTAFNYGVAVKSFIMNNHIYGITKAFQKTNFQGRMEACGPVGYNPPDFLAIAKAYKVKTVQIDNNAGIDAGIEAVLNHDGPVVCDVNMHEYHAYEPRIFGWATPIEDMYPYLPREEFRRNMLIEPHETWTNPKYPDVHRDRAKETAME